MTTNHVILSEAKNPSGSCPKSRVLWLEVKVVACLFADKTYFFTTLKGILHSASAASLPSSFRMTWLKGFFPRYARSGLFLRQAQDKL
jgi:hypothetical protein